MKTSRKAARVARNRKAARVEKKVTCVEAPKGFEDLVGVTGWLALDHDAAGRVTHALFDPVARGIPNAEFKVRDGNVTARAVELVETGRGALRWSFVSGTRRTSRATPAKKPVVKKKVATKRPAKKATRKKAAAPKKRTFQVSSKKRESTKKASSETLSEQDAIALAHKLLAEWGVAGYGVVFSSGRRMYRAMGLCDYKNHEIRFSRPIWPLASNEQRRETVIHEVAHAIVYERAPHDRSARGHGAKWKTQMRAMGIKSPSAYHEVEVVGLWAGKRKNMVTITCCRGMKQDITIRRLQRILAEDGKCRCPDGSDGTVLFATQNDRRKFEQYLQPNSARIHACGC